MTTIIKWMNNPLVLAILVCAGVLLDIILLGRGYQLTRSDWAGWVQAIGSIGAIIGAVWVAAAQNKNARERERAAVVEQIRARDESVMLVIDHCFSMVYGLPGKRAQHKEYETHAQEVPSQNFVNLQTLLRSAPLYEVRNQEVVAAAMYMMDLMESTIGLLTFMDSYTPQQRAEGWISLRLRLQELRQRAWTIHRKMRAVD